MFCYPDAEHLREQFHYTLHALPVDKWEVLLTYHPPSIIQCLCYLSSPKLSDCILGDPVTRSPEISTQTFSNGKILEIKTFASTAAISAAVASLSAWQFTIYLLCWGHLGLQQILVSMTVHMLHQSSDSGGCHAEAFEVS
jgi:hypothetical protein